MAALDSKTISELKSLMGDKYHAVFEAFYKSAEQYIEEIRQALDNGDVYKIERASHALKGSSANIGASVLSNACSMVVERARSSEKDGYEALFDDIEKEYAAVKSEIDAILSE